MQEGADFDIDIEKRSVTKLWVHLRVLDQPLLARSLVFASECNQTSRWRYDCWTKRSKETSLGVWRQNDTTKAFRGNLKVYEGIRDHGHSLWRANKQAASSAIALCCRLELPLVACVWVRTGTLYTPRSHPVVHLRLNQGPFQRSTLPYCKFYGSCIKLWSCPGIDPARPPTIWICGPRAYTLCTFLIKRYCNCGLTSKHHGLQQRLYSRLPRHPQPPTSLLPPYTLRSAPCTLPFYLLQLYRAFFMSFNDLPG